MMTKNCIICNQTAKVWTGHVVRKTDKKIITAGWCRNHIHKSDDITLMKSAGCFGEWNQVNGIKENFESPKK